VTDEDIRNAVQVISLATELPATKPFVKPKLLEWNDIPPISADYDRARQVIFQRVEALVKNLSARPQALVGMQAQRFTRTRDE
jgi:hypothetical protein